MTAGLIITVYMKENIRILTELLRQHGVDMMVVCPGSRNAPMVHHFDACGMKCVPVTDERSAGFYAIGMAQAAAGPVGVCVTSGTALLNLSPAVAEAYYRNVPLVVISADRPQAWIGQLDGQTMPQPGALGCFAGKSVTLPEPAGGIERWHCARLVNEAMLVARRGRPVHINVPVSEPLFDFTINEKPGIRAVRALRNDELSPSAMREIARRFFAARRPMVVVGQTDCLPELGAALNALSEYAVVLHEPLGAGGGAVHFDEVLYCVADNPDYRPDFVIYAGGTVVSKRLKEFIRKADGAETWAISADGEIHDTFMNQTAVIEGDACRIISRLADGIAGRNAAEAATDDAGRGVRTPAETPSVMETAPAGTREFRDRWHAALAGAGRHAAAYEPAYSQMMAVRMFESMLDDLDYDFCVHYANSSAVRLADIYANHYIYVNRGVNGIDGSLSTAAGFSVVCGKMTFCVTGDLSFFYDCNALWNRCLRGNLRILLLNNCGGGIFRMLPGLEASPVRDSHIAAGHHASAHGLCDTHDIGYLSARNADELSHRMETFLYSGTRRPLVFEVFTDADDDVAAVKAYYENGTNGHGNR